MSRSPWRRASIEFARGSLVGCSGFGGSGARQFFFVKRRASPRDPRVVDLVWDAVVVEWAEQFLPDSIDEVAAIDEVVSAKRQEVSAISSLWRCGEAEQEFGGESLEDAAIGRRLRVVELVDDDVVEVIRRESFEVLLSRQCLHGREEDCCVCVALLPHVAAERGAGSDASERGESLFEDLLAMSDEEHSLEALRIEGAEPRLAEARREHDEACPITLFASGIERSKRFLLDAVWLGRRRNFRLDARQSRRVGASALAIRFNPRLRQFDG